MGSTLYMIWETAVSPERDCLIVNDFNLSKTYNPLRTCLIRHDGILRFGLGKAPVIQRLKCFMGCNELWRVLKLVNRNRGII